MLELIFRGILPFIEGVIHVIILLFCINPHLKILNNLDIFSPKFLKPVYLCCLFCTLIVTFSLQDF